MRRGVACAFLVVLIGLGALATATVIAQTSNPPSLDGSAKNGCGYASSCSVMLTTANPSDVIVVGCNCWPVGGSFSVSDTAGLAFLPRTAPVAIGGGQFIQTWYSGLIDSSDF